MTSATRQPLHIGVDAREILGRPTGVGRYVAEILRAWAADRDVVDRFTLFLPDHAPDWAHALGSNFVVTSDTGRSAGTWWEQRRLPHLVSQSRVQVLLSPAYTAPLGLSCPSVLAVHDVSFFVHPEWFGWREGLRRRWLTKAAAHRARAIAALSECAARDVICWLDVAPERVRVIRPGGPPLQCDDTPDRPPTVLFVGSLFNRRHLPDLISGFARALASVPDARLVLVGDNRTSPRLDPLALADARGIRSRVEWREYVSDEELHRLYASARVFAFLSEYEGFALTPLEALAHGVPSLLLDTPVAQEVYAGAALFVPVSEERIAKGLVDLLTDAALRTRLLEAGRRRMDDYSWPRAARQLLDLLAHAAAPQ